MNSQRDGVPLMFVVVAGNADTILPLMWLCDVTSWWMQGPLVVTFSLEVSIGRHFS